MYCVAVTIYKLVRNCAITNARHTHHHTHCHTHYYNSQLTKSNKHGRNLGFPFFPDRETGDINAFIGRRKSRRVLCELVGNFFFNAKSVWLRKVAKSNPPVDFSSGRRDDILAVWNWILECSDGRCEDTPCDVRQFFKDETRQCVAHKGANAVMRKRRRKRNPLCIPEFRGKCPSTVACVSVVTWRWEHGVCNHYAIHRVCGCAGIKKFGVKSTGKNAGVWVKSLFRFELIGNVVPCAVAHIFCGNKWNCVFLSCVVPLKKKENERKRNREGGVSSRCCVGVIRVQVICVVQGCARCTV